MSLISQSPPPGSLGTVSQEESIHTYSCKWAWCRSTFHDKNALANHVIHEHARRAIPVRRRDIPLIRRAEEGTGESFQISYLMAGSSSNSAADSSQKSAGQPSQDLASQPALQPSSSLPSPPVSSPASSSNAQPLPDSAIPLSVTPDTQLSQQQIPDSPPSFASLGSPDGSVSSFAIPNSPAFSSLVERPVKRKFDFDATETPSPRKSNVSKYHPLSQSTSSTGSQLSVEQQLTQSSDDGLDDDASDRDAMGEDDVSEQQSFEQEMVPEILDIPALSPALDQDTAIYKSELSWALSHSQSDNFQQDSESGTSLELMSQPPSQFQHTSFDSFPFHSHEPRNSRLPDSQPAPNSSGPLHLSAPAPLPSPTFAASTPLKQNWYQTPKRKRSSKNRDSSVVDEERVPSPVKPDQPASLTQSRHSRGPSKSKMFRSGTLQITPVAAARESIAVVPENVGEVHMHDADSQGINDDDLENPESQSYLDSSQSLQDYSYPPLQTQAPYQSQSMTQF